MVTERKYSGTNIYLVRGTDGSILFDTGWAEGNFIFRDRKLKFIGDVMFFQVSTIAILIAFYGFYITKIILQNKKSIKTNQMGMGNKPKKVFYIEKIMSLAAVLAMIADICSIFAGKDFLHL